MRQAGLDHTCHRLVNLVLPPLHAVLVIHLSTIISGRMQPSLYHGWLDYFYFSG